MHVPMFPPRISAMATGTETRFAAANKTANSVINLDHSQWDILLKKYVDEDGLVDYAGFKNDREALNSYMNTQEGESS